MPASFSYELTEVLLRAYDEESYFNELVEMGTSASGLNELSAADISQLALLLADHATTLQGIDALRTEIAPAVSWISAR